MSTRSGSVVVRERVADRELFFGVAPWDGVGYDTSQISVFGAPIVVSDKIYKNYRIPLYTDQYETYNRNSSLFLL